MKNWLTAALLLTAAAAHAQVVPIALSTGTTCAPVSCSSSTPTAVYTPAAAPAAGGFQMVVSAYNTSASSAVYFSQDVAVSSLTTSAHLGWPVGAGTSRDWTLLPYQVWKCLAGSNTSAITIVACITK